MKRRLLCILLAAAVAVGGTGCGTGSGRTSESGGAGETRTQEGAGGPGETSSEGESEEEETEFQPGSWAGLTFMSPWLKLRITVPDGSYVFTREEIEEAVGAGREAVSENLSYTDSQEAVIDAATKYEFMAALPDGQGNIQFACENVRETNGGPMPEVDYLYVLSGKLLSLKDMGYRMIGITEEELGGQRFTRLAATLMDDALYQDYYCLARGDYMAVISITYAPQSQDVVKDFLEGIAEEN